MAEIFPADTNTEAKNAVYKFACEAVMNLMRAEVLAVVGTTKTDLRASLAHSVVMHLEVTMMQFLSFDEMPKQRPPGQHNNYDGIPHDLRDQFIFHNETLFSILRNMMREDIN